MHRRLTIGLFSLVLLATAHAQSVPPTVVVRAFGDLNLGRSVGQELLNGDIDYPFVHMREFLRGADVVFANLESQLSDQGGETQHPRDNYVFCGPPVGAKSLSRSGIHVVSTANNHAYDYGMKGLRETITFLQGDGILHVGTSQDSVESFPPVVVERNGMRLGFVAYTEFVNVRGPWFGRISLFDRVRAKRELDSLRKISDVVIASYHGGAEYTDQPHNATQHQMRFLADNGADVVLGHHPHVPQGIEDRDGRLIFYSLGNFVFYQPQRRWTQIGIGVEFIIEKPGREAKISSVRIIPIRVGKQPTLMLIDEDRTALYERLVRLSSIPIQQEGTTFVIRQ